MDQATFNTFQAKIDRKIAMIYLSGSHLNQLETKDSDIDYVIVTIPSFTDVVSGHYKNKQHHHDIDTKIMNVFQFLTLMKKSNPNMLELLYCRPVYCESSFKPFAAMLFDRRDEIAHLNEQNFYNAALGMIKQHADHATLAKMGKSLVNANKAALQLAAVANRLPLDDAVRFKGKQRDALISLKTRPYTEHETAMTTNAFAQFATAIEQVNEQVEFKPLDETLWHELIVALQSVMVLQLAQVE